MNNALLKRNEELAKEDFELDLKKSILFQEIDKILHTGDDNNDALKEYEDELDELDGHDTAALNISPSNKVVTIVPQPVINHEPELKFLRAKIKILTGEIERQRKEYQRKATEWQTKESEMVKMRHERDKQQQQNVAQSQQISKISALIEEQTEKLQRYEADNLKLTQELNGAKKEAKLATQRASTLELRLNRITEECESLKAALRTAQLKNKEEREEHRHTLEQQSSCVKRAERQRNELALAFRRQMLLCNNLQRQKEILIAGAALKEAETQFDFLLSSKKSTKSRDS